MIKPGYETSALKKIPLKTAIELLRKNERKLLKARKKSIFPYKWNNIPLHNTPEIKQQSPQI